MIKAQSVILIQKRMRLFSAWERGKVEVFIAEWLFELDFDNWVRQ